MRRFLLPLAPGTPSAWSFRSGRSPGFLLQAAFPSHTHFLQNHLQRAKVRKRRLKQVETNKCGEPKPIRAMVMRQQKAGDDEHSGEPADEQMHFHFVWPGCVDLQPES